MSFGDLSALTDPSKLRELLNDSLARVERKDVALAVHVAGRSACAWARSGEPAGRGSREPFAPIPLGCITKLLTAEIALEAVRTGALELDTPVPRPARMSRHAARSAVTLRHLLEHTHGFDDSLLERVPRRAGGWIDERTLWTALSAVPPLAAPGHAYSYGNAGAWLAAGILERTFGRSYIELAAARIARFAPADPCLAALRARAVRETQWCPAGGGALGWPLATVLAFLVHDAIEAPRRWPADECAGTFGAVQPLPGWNPLEHGVHVGWKAHGGGWFGHGSTWPGAAMLVRVQPQRKIALVVMSRTHPAPVVAVRVLGRVLPDLFEVRLPALRANECTRSAVRVAYANEYRCASRSVRIHAAHHGLAAELAERAADGSMICVRAKLREAAGGIFFSEPPALPSFAYVQFLDDDDGEPRFLWNGRFMLRAAR